MRSLRRLVLLAPLFVSTLLAASFARADDATQTPTPNVVVVETAPPPSSPPTASAPVASVDPLVRPKYRSHWYGWQTLTFDGAAIVGGIGLAELQFKDAGWFWIGTYALAPPAVHLAHGRVGIAFADLGLRVAAPTATTLIGYELACTGHQSLDDLGACIAGMGLGFVIGYGAAVAVDAAVLSRENVEVTPSSNEALQELEREKRKRASTFSILPDVGVGQNRATLGLRGGF